MPGRGLTQKESNAERIVLARNMVTRRYRMTWDLQRCVGCDIGPKCCPKQAVIHIPGEIAEGRLTRRPCIDIDAERCVLCGICEPLCPKNAVTLTINGQRENPVLIHGAFPQLTRSTTFNRTLFDWNRRQQVIDNCPTQVIRCDEAENTLVVDHGDCIHCRQCEVASGGAFQVEQPWEGRVELNRDRCAAGCRACADICPTRALYVSTSADDPPDTLQLADYYCIKCGACMQVCPIQAAYEEIQTRVTVLGVEKTVTTRRLTNSDHLPVRVERWRARHTPVQSAAWLDALRQLADDKAGAVEIDRKRALKRRDLIKALAGV